MPGVVGGGFDPTTDGGRAHGSAQGWVLDSITGELCHAGRDSDWEGQPVVDDDEGSALEDGDVVVRLPPLPPRAGKLTLCAARRACCSTSTRRP